MKSPGRNIGFDSLYPLPFFSLNIKALDRAENKPVDFSDRFRTVLARFCMKHDGKRQS